MQILKANLGNYRNEEHFQFQTELKGLVEQYTPETLNIETVWADYLASYEKERATLDLVRKSPLTEEIGGADQKRDLLGTGLGYTVQGATNHFDPAKKEAAVRVMVVLENYSGISRKSYDEQTAAINSLVDDLNGNYAADIATLGLAEWVSALKAANDAFVALMHERYSEEAGKPQYNMKAARTEVDSAYHTITERIDALIIVNGERGYEGFVNELNQRIEKYNRILARREGRNAKKEEEE
jgi:hypothetical protein